MTRFQKIALVVMIPFILCLGLVIALISPLGSQVLQWVANTYVEELSIDDISGSVLSGLTIEGIRYTGTPDLSLAKAELAINWQETHLNQITLSKIVLQQGKVRLASSTNTEESKETEPTPSGEQALFTSPVPIDIESIVINDFSMTQPELEIEIGDFGTSLHFDESLIVSETYLNRLSIYSSAKPEQRPPFEKLEYTAPNLPTIFIPLKATIDGLTVSALTYQTPEASQTVRQIRATTLQTEGAKVTWDTIDIEHDKGRITTTGTISLAESYPLELTLSGEAHIDENTHQEVKLATAGSLEALKLDAQLSGLVTGTVTMRLNILNNALPVDGKITWPEQRVDYQQIIALKPGELLINGDMSNYQLRINSALQIEKLNEVLFIADIELGGSDLVVKQLDAKLLNGEIVTSANLNFAGSLSANGQTQIRNIDLSTLTPNLSSATISTAGWDYKINQNGDKLLLELANIEGLFNVEEQAINLDGDVTYDQSDEVLSANLRVNQPNSPNSIALTANVKTQQSIEINAKIDVPQVGRFLPDLNGALNGTVALNGDWQDPLFDVNVQASNIKFSERMSPFLHQQGAYNGRITLVGDLTRHRLSMLANMNDNRVNFAASGALLNDIYEGQIERSELVALNTRWVLPSSAVFSINTKTKDTVLSKHCWQLSSAYNTEQRVSDTHEGSLCVEESTYQKNVANWAVNAKHLPIGDWAKASIGAIAEVSDSASLSFTHQGQFDVNKVLNASLNVNVAESTWTLGEANPISIDLKQVDLRAKLNEQMITVEGTLLGTNIGSLNLALSASQDDFLEGDISADINIDNLDLKPLSYFSPSVHKLEGVINGDITVSGLGKKPEVNGRIALSKGAVSVEQAPLSLSEWEQSFTLSGQKATIDGSFLLGEGRGQLGGELSWQDAPYANFTVDASDIAVQHEQSIVRVSPKLTAKITPDDVDVSGDINIPYARIKIKEVPKSAVTPSKDVRILDEQQSDDPIQNINFDININIDPDKSKNVRLDAFGLTASLNGGLNVQSQPSLVAFGDLSVVDGRYKAYGQNLLIRSGEVQFNGPPNRPFLFVEAIRDPELTEDGVIAGVRIDGAASAPSVALFSEPPMEQAQNLLYLINGRGNLSGGDSDPNYGAMLLGLGLSQSGKVTNSIGKSLGIEDLSLTSTGQGSDSQISLSGNITKDLSVRFGVGLSDGQEVAIRYRILPNLYLQAVRQFTEAVSLIDLFYEFSLGDPAKKPLASEEN
jgi:translocation and assembly module TamB